MVDQTAVCTIYLVPQATVCCVVLDEAHKAQGNYAYVDVVTQLWESSRRFRVLGLSATPGKDSRRRARHSAAPPSTSSRCSNSDGERASAE